MGASSSAGQPPSEQQAAEALAASTGALPLLQKAFSSLADPQTNLISVVSLQEVFNLGSENLASAENPLADRLSKVLDYLGRAVVDVFFMVEKGGISWTEFVKGYTKCCGRISSSVALGNLLKVFALSSEKAGFPVALGFECDEEDQEITMSGALSVNDMTVLLWMCWLMSFYSFDLEAWKIRASGDLPDVDHLVLSAVESCAENASSVNTWESDLSGLDVQLPAVKLKSWFTTTVPQIASCFSKFVHSGLQNSIRSKDKAEPSSASEVDGTSNGASGTLLTHGRAWAFSLSMRSTISEDFLKACFPIPGNGSDDILLYRSSYHGKGMNRFWSNVEGYNGPVLILISACSEDTNDRRWIIGVQTQQGFENHDSFYGSSGCLYAVSPVFHAFAASGKEKNFIYSHLHLSGKAYEPKPKPVGIGFGGSIGNERIFMDEDFAKIIIRHHAVDKTYQHGSLIPNQGFLPVEAAVFSVEVWGLGGRSIKAQQDSHKKREELFTEQRRKVDLKTFSNWEDSPEKMMMDMMSNPNAVRREDR
uniref:TLDc domain-containing protein n=1 Tax=Kalanchoe fedtschenkoi TaxID=63787 RepID=A0A7N0R9P9_KALFE